MTSRRTFTKQCVSTGLAITLARVMTGCGKDASGLVPVGGKSSSTPVGAFVMPDEGHRHSATWMAYGATAAAWGTTGVYGASRAIARADLMRIAANLSRFEPVKMLVASESDKAEAAQHLRQVRTEPVGTSIADYQSNGVFTGEASLPQVEAGGAIELIIQPLDDLWIRDTGPVFVLDSNRRLGGVNLNFNGWGQENTGAAGWKKDPAKAANGIVNQPIGEDQLLADFVARHAGAHRISTWLVMEGGGLEVDGRGTALCTESSILNRNRNPGRTKAEVESELLRLLGIRKVIWLPGLRGQDITDGHVDFYARFVGPGKVVYALDEDPHSPDYTATQQNKSILETATDAMGKRISAVALSAPDLVEVQSAVEARNHWSSSGSHFNANGFAGGYVGFFVANGCVLMGGFGDAGADKAAFNTVQGLFPDRAVMQITTDGIANGGGTIHCATQQQPFV